MPRYDYRCRQCNLNFFIICGINDSRENVTCTGCGSTDLARKFKPIILKGKRARGYEDESREIKQSETETKTTDESKEVKQSENETKTQDESKQVKQSETETKTQEVSHASNSHDQCSPERDYE